MTLCVFADSAPTIVQADWQSLSALGSLLGGSLVVAARILAGQWDKNSLAEAKRHEESRADAKEARDENRALSQAILTIQGKTVETLAGVQHEIDRVVTRLDRLEGGSKSHVPVPHGT